MPREMQNAVIKALEQVEQVIAWGPGPDAIHSSPCFMRSESDVAALKVDMLSVHNPAVFLPDLKGTKTGVVLKGCDSRSVNQLLAEELISRDDLYIIGFGCKGVIDHDKLCAELTEKTNGECEPGQIQKAELNNGDLVLSLADRELRLPVASIKAEKCKRCKYPNTLVYDEFIGDKVEPACADDEYDDLAEFAAMPLKDRLAFWEKEMEHCTRCYACRNACPLCVCRDQCVALSRDPLWVSQADGVKEKLFFQIIHATHLAGRCTGCGECQRACPVGIPLLLMKRSLTRGIERLFDYEAGLDAKATPPLLTFKIDEQNIKERDW